MKKSTEGREITTEDRIAAARLRTLWKQRCADLDLTQTKLAKRWECSQSLISQYMNAAIALNTDIVFKFAAELGVNPHDIDPRVPALLPLAEYKRRPIKVRFPQMLIEDQRDLAASPNEIMAPATSEHVYAIPVIDQRYAPRIVKGDYLTLNPTNPPQPGKLVVAWFKDRSFTLGRYRAGNTPGTLTLASINEQTNETYYQVQAVHPVEAILPEYGIVQ